MSAVSELIRRRAAKNPARDAAQAWYNDLLGGTHWVGDKLLRVFGLGEISDTMAETEGAELPDWSRTDEQRSRRREAEAAAQQEADIRAAELRQAEALRQEEATRQQNEAADAARAAHLRQVAEDARLTAELFEQQARAGALAEMDRLSRESLANR